MLSSIPGPIHKRQTVRRQQFMPRH